MRVQWFIGVALVSLAPSFGAAQQMIPPDVARPNAGNIRVAPGGAVTPLLLSGQPEQVPERVPELGALPGMTLAQLEDMAARCNPTLAQAAARVQAAHGQYVQAGLYPNPVVGYQASEIGDEGRAGQQGGFIGQEVVTAGKLRLNRDIASQEIRQAEYAWEAQRFRVLSDVRRAFYDVLVAQRRWTSRNSWSASVRKASNPPKH